MKIYNIKDEYIAYLRQFDEKVAINKKESRPYVGIVLEIGTIKYYAPLSSPKPKHRKMKNGKDFRKIANGAFGAINFNNMIPVLASELILIDIDSIEDVQYRRLIQNQVIAIRADKDGIFRTAKELYALLLKDENTLTDFEKRIKERCCNVQLLEKVYTTFIMK